MDTYFINASKCWLLLKDPAAADAALFDGTGVNVCGLTKKSSFTSKTMDTQ